MNALFLITALLVAHGGEDHGEPAAAPVVLSGDVRRASAASETFEVLVRWTPGPSDDRALELFLADAATNAPVSGATVTLHLGSVTASALATRDPGVYAAQFRAPATVTPMTVSIAAGTRGDLLTLDLDLRAAEVAVASPPHDDSLPWLWIALGAAALVIMTLAGFLGGRAVGRAARVGALFIVLGSVDARAHGGEDHGAPVSSPTAGPSDVRFVPKELQFLLSIRTASVTETTLVARQRVPGKVVAPFDALAIVRAPRTGRVEASAGGVFPAIGARVKAGQVLAVVLDLPSGTELASLDAERARARGTIDQANARLRALRAELGRREALPNIVAQGELDTLRGEIRALEAEVRAGQATVNALSPDGKTLRVELVAPIDGIVAAVGEGLGVGAVVAADTAVFTIVRPERLQVAARVFETLADRVDPATPAIVGATASGTLVGVPPLVDPETRVVELRYALAETAAARLRLQQFISVDVPLGAQTESLVVPSGAVDEVEGRPVVYVKLGPETFVARPVAITLRAGSMVAIKGDLHAGDKVVVEGASFIELASPPPVGVK